MAKTKTIMKIFTIADYEEEEKWLASQHGKGWRLTKVIIPFFYVFEASEPEKVIYQLEFKESKVTDDYLKMYEDYGWEYFGTYLGWNYFRKPESEIETESDREIFSDAESKIAMIEQVFQSRIWPLLIVFVAVILPQLSDLDKDVFKTSDIVFLIIYLAYISLR